MTAAQQERFILGRKQGPSLRISAFFGKDLLCKQLGDRHALHKTIQQDLELAFMDCQHNVEGHMPKFPHMSHKISELKRWPCSRSIARG